MGFFNKVMASVGIGGAKVEVKLNPGAVPMGGFARGEIILRGGKLEQKCNGIIVKLRRISVVRVTVDGKSVDQNQFDTLQEENLAQYEQTISPGSEMRFDFNIMMPASGGAEDRISYEIVADADIPGAIDPSHSVKVATTKAAEVTVASIPHLIDVARGLHRQGSDKYGELEGQLRVILSLDEKHTEALKLSAQVVGYRNGAEAAPFWKRYLEQVPADGEGWSEFASNAHSRGAHEEALAHAGKATELAPQNSGYFSLKARILDTLKRHDEAAAAYDKALAGDYPSSRLHMDKAEQLRKAGKKDAAIASYLAAGRMADAYNLGEILDQLAELGQPQHEAELIQLAKEKQPEDPTPFQVEAERLLKSNSPAASLAALDLALRKDVNSDWTRSNLHCLKGKAFEALQKKPEAKQAYTDALAAYKDNSDAKARLKAL